MIMLYEVRIKTDFISSVAATRLLRMSSTEIGSAWLCRNDRLNGFGVRAAAVFVLLIDLERVVVFGLGVFMFELTKKFGCASCPGRRL